MITPRQNKKLSNVSRQAMGLWFLIQVWLNLLAEQNNVMA